ncbi:hypothetical protein BURK2_02888 [Burkholderiales bacterium]|nr:MAG: hypothetical protein F9K47_13470 [Burkholderiales bacterium]CAG0999336.1 hypothetical protein BURK2_02888 [Burkholderiales bacterium]
MKSPAPQAAVAFLSRNAHLWLAAHRTRHGTPAGAEVDSPLREEIFAEIGERWGITPQAIHDDLWKKQRAAWAKM